MVLEYSCDMLYSIEALLQFLDSHRTTGRVLAPVGSSNDERKSVAVYPCRSHLVSRRVGLRPTLSRFRFPEIETAHPKSRIMASLDSENISKDAFTEVLSRYSGVIPSKLEDLEVYRMDTLPELLKKRRDSKNGSWMEKSELVKLVEWKL